MKKALLYIALIAIFSLVIGSWWNFSGSLIATGVLANTLKSIARLVGLIAAVMLLMQLVFIGRVKWVESVFGLDKLSRLHRTNGYIILGLILLHPFLMTLSYSMISEVGYITQTQTFLKYWNNILLAFIGYITLISTIFLSISIVRRKLKYEWWYSVHILNYLAVILIFFHTVETTPGAYSKPWLMFWYGLYIFTFGNVIWFRFTRPVIKFAKHKFTVNRVEDLGLATSIYISGRNMEKFKIKAGQFMIFRFLQKGFWTQAHPFSMSIAPNGKELRLTSKKIGDYTNTLPGIEVGTKVLIDGPHGVFTEDLIKKGKLLFIAGGVGITPIRSMLEALGSSHPDKILLYSNKSPKETLLANELEHIRQENGFKLVNIYSDIQVAGAEYGKLDEAMLSRLVPDIIDRDIFLCGPPPMMTALRDAMVKLGVPKNQINFERFAL